MTSNIHREVRYKDIKTKYTYRYLYIIINMWEIYTPKIEIHLSCHYIKRLLNEKYGMM